MSCSSWQALASGELDARLSAEEGRALEVHQLLCRECSERSAELRALKRLLVAAPIDPPDIEFGRELLGRLEAERGPGLPELLRRALSPFCGTGTRRGLLPCAAAASLLLAVLPLRAPRGSAGYPGGVLSSAPRPAPSGAPGSASSPAAALPARDLSLLTVWDSSAATIVTSSDPSGQAGHDAVAAPARRPPPRKAYEAATAPEVRIFLFERIVVKG